MRFALYIVLTTAYNLILFAVVKSLFLQGVAVTMSKGLIYTLIALIAGNLLLMYMVILRAPGGAFYQNFDQVFKKYYNGKNYDEAYKKAMKEWAGGRFTVKHPKE